MAQESSQASRRRVGGAVEPCPLHWVQFRVVSDKTGEPVPGIALEVKSPGGETTSRVTDGDGLITIDSAEPGSYELTSSLENANYFDTCEPVAVQHSPKKVEPDRQNNADQGPTEGDEEPDEDEDEDEEEETQEEEPEPSRPGCIARITEHKVQTGETLDGIARANGMTWRALAYFNWQTREPREINRHLRDDVGCTKKSRDGYNYSFRSEDNPGIVYVPEKWEAKGLASDACHTIRVKSVNVFLIILENEQGLRIPEAEYEATFSGGGKRKGRLGRNGVARIEDPPPGEVEAVFPDLDDVEAKSLAACVREAFDRRDPREVYRILGHSPDGIQSVVEAYNAYYNTHTGKGLIEDIYQETTDPDALMVVEGLLAAAGQPTHSRVEYARWQPDFEFEEEEPLD